MLYVVNLSYVYFVTLCSYQKRTSAGAAKHRGGIFTSHPAAQRSILGVSKSFSLDVAEIYRRQCSEEWTET